MGNFTDKSITHELCYYLTNIAHSIEYISKDFYILPGCKVFVHTKITEPKYRLFFVQHGLSMNKMFPYSLDPFLVRKKILMFTVFGGTKKLFYINISLHVYNVTFL